MTQPLRLRQASRHLLLALALGLTACKAPAAVSSLQLSPAAASLTVTFAPARRVLYLPTSDWEKLTLTLSRPGGETRTASAEATRDAATGERRASVTLAGLAAGAYTLTLDLQRRDPDGAWRTLATDAQPVTLAAGANAVTLAGLGERLRATAPLPATTAGERYVSSLPANGASSRLNGPAGAVCDAAGNTYVADLDGNRIRKVTPDGLTTTVAGDGNYGFADGPGAKARFAAPSGIALDAAGNLLVADSDNCRIRRIVLSPTGAATVTTIAGDGNDGFADGPGATAQFYYPSGVALDAVGNLFVTDSGNDRIRKLTFDASGAATVSTVAGDGNRGFLDGAGTIARFYAPRCLALNTAGDLFVSDYGNYRIRKLTFDAMGAATVTTVAGDGNSGFAEGPGASARFGSPKGLAFSAAGDLFVADSGNNRIRKLEFDGSGAATVTTVAGDGSSDLLDGPGASARFNSPTGLAFDATGRLLVADLANYSLRAITFAPGGEATVTTTAGDGNWGDVDGRIMARQFNTPNGVVPDAAGNLLVADTDNHRIRKITFAADGATTIVTVAGGPEAGYVDGPGASARFNQPVGLALDAAGNLFVTDSSNNRIRKLSFDATGAATVSTVAGDGNGDFQDGPGTSAWFNNPLGLALDAAGNLFVADAYNCRIRKLEFDAGGAATVTTVAGDGNWDYLDGPGATAQFRNPSGLALDKAGRLFVADSDNGRIRMLTFDATGTATVSTVAGDGGGGGAPAYRVLLAGVPALSVSLNQPTGLALDAEGALYVSDTNNQLIRRVVIPAEGADVPTITTVAGDGIAGFLDGPASRARFKNPTGLAIDAKGRLIVSDSTNHLLRMLSAPRP